MTSPFAWLFSAALMVARRIAVFFYGLFMDADLLRAKGADPVNIRPACVPGFALRIGQRATLLRDLHARVYGMLMELTHAEIDQLYFDPSVRAYRPDRRARVHECSGPASISGPL